MWEVSAELAAWEASEVSVELAESAVLVVWEVSVELAGPVAPAVLAAPAELVELAGPVAPAASAESAGQTAPRTCQRAAATGPTIHSTGAARPIATGPQRTGSEEARAAIRWGSAARVRSSAPGVKVERA